MSRFRVKLNYTPALLYPRAYTRARTLVYAFTRANIRIRELLSRTNYMESVVYASEYPGMFAGGPLLEKIRLDNATIRYSTIESSKCL